MLSREELMAQAKASLQHAYAPYSNFPVSSAIEMKDGRVFVGVNVENVSFGATNCAERSAVFTAASAGYRPGDVVAIAVAGKTEDFLPPCSICRQVLVEWCQPNTPVHLLNGADEIKTVTMADLAPYAFTALEM